MSYQANLNLVKTWSWYKKMPKLMKEFFDSKFMGGESVRFSKMMAEEKYYDVMAMAKDNN